MTAEQLGHRLQLVAPRLVAVDDPRQRRDGLAAIAAAVVHEHDRARAARDADGVDRARARGRPVARVDVPDHADHVEGGRRRPRSPKAGSRPGGLNMHGWKPVALWMMLVDLPQVGFARALAVVHRVVAEFVPVREDLAVQSGVGRRPARRSGRRCRARGCGRGSGGCRRCRGSVRRRRSAPPTCAWSGPWRPCARPNPVQPTRRTGSIFVVALPLAGARSVHVASARREPLGAPGAQAGPYQLLCAAKLSLPGFRPIAPRLKSRTMPRFDRFSLAEIDPAPADRLLADHRDADVDPVVLDAPGRAEEPPTDRLRGEVEAEVALAACPVQVRVVAQLGQLRQRPADGDPRLQVRVLLADLDLTRSSGPGVSAGITRDLGVRQGGRIERAGASASDPARINLLFIPPPPGLSPPHRWPGDGVAPQRLVRRAHSARPVSTSRLSPVCARAAPPRSRSSISPVTGSPSRRCTVRMPRSVFEPYFPVGSHVDFPADQELLSPDDQIAAGARLEVRVLDPAAAGRAAGR